MGHLRERASMLAVAALLGLAAIGGGLAGCGGSDDDTEDTGTAGSVLPDQAVAQDAEAKAAARNGQVALEVYATDQAQGGSYEGATVDALKEIEPTLGDADLTVTADAQTYEVTAESESGNSFTVTKEANGAITNSCETEGEGGCPDGGDW